MYKRSYIDEDPYVNIGDHPIDVMYAEVAYPHHNHLVSTRGGMDVFIKKSSSGRSQYISSGPIPTMLKSYILLQGPGLGILIADYLLILHIII